MKIIELDTLSYHGLKTSLSLGFFDGVHLGHQKLLEYAVNDARQCGRTPAVFTFREHPLSLIAPEKEPPMLTTFSERMDLMAQKGIELAVWAHFDENLKRLHADEFIHSVIHSRLGAHMIVVGSNYHFGFGAEGTVSRLVKAGETMGFRVITLPPVKLDDETISSTLLRNTVKAGDMRKASQMLGRPYQVSGILSDAGTDSGGIRYASFRPDREKLLPHEGSYHVQADHCTMNLTINKAQMCMLYSEGRDLSAGQAITVHFPDQSRSSDKAREAPCKENRCLMN